MKMPHPRWSLATILMILVLSIGVVSCGKTSNKEDLSKQALNSGEAQSDSAFSIRFRPQWYHQAQFAGVYMAAKKGFYRDYGLKVDIQTGGPDYPAYDAIENGSTDITQLFLLTALTRDVEHNNLINLAQLSQKSSLMLVGKKSQGIKSIQDLNNKSIGLWRTDFRELSLIFLQQNKLQMNIVNVDWTVNLFLNNVVEVINVMRYNEYHQILQAGIDPEELFVIPFCDVGLNIIEDGLYTTREFYLKHPGQCKNFAEATMDGWLYAINHQEETLDVVLDIMRRHHIRANRPHQAWMLNEMRDVILMHPQGIGVLENSDFIKARELLSQQKVPVSKQEYQDFYPHAQ